MKKLILSVLALGLLGVSLSSFAWYYDPVYGYYFEKRPDDTTTYNFNYNNNQQEQPATTTSTTTTVVVVNPNNSQATPEIETQQGNQPPVIINPNQ